MSTEPKPTPPVVTMEEFFTRSRANEGVRLPLTTPDGRDTPHWIHIRGIDSDHFKAVEARIRREAMDLVNIKDAAELQSKTQEHQLRLIASLVMAWSFGKECTEANVVEFLREAPQIGNEIDRLSSRRRLFFKNGSTNSTSTPLPSSS